MNATLHLNGTIDALVYAIGVVRLMQSEGTRDCGDKYFKCYDMIEELLVASTYI